MTAYSDGGDPKLVINDPINKELYVDQMFHMIENLKNPYDEMYHWCKGEIYDL
jgi:hypothetical protein